ncbi:MAG: hypothetical protein DWP97_14415 [Calditrichaeota bacterium]|nr:MAG: hypothetical protein DWP97_14415 [Calditrichota bacterium]
MMKRFVLILVFSLLVYPNAYSDILSHASYQGGYSGNLFNDSLAYDDVFNSFGGSIQVYPSNSVELQGAGYYTAYSGIPDLSNLYGNLSVKAIHDSYESDFSLLAGGNLYFQNYGEEFEIYDYWSANSNVSGIYRARYYLSFTLGGYLTHMKYVNEEAVTNNEFGGYSGFNLTLPGRNTVDAEVQVYRKKFNSILDVNGREIDLEYDFIDLNLSFARPISESTGLNVSYLHRIISDKDQFAVAGYTVDYLSPWSSLWDGERVSLSIKKIFPKEITMVLYGSYFEKSYVPVIDVNPSSDVSRLRRSDENVYAAVTLSKNIYFTNTLLTPSVDVSYTDNRSNLSLYEYDKLLVMLSLSYGF